VTLNSYATALANNNQFDKAFELFEKSKEIKPDETVTLNSYATALANNNQFDEAFELFEQSKNIKPDETVTLTSYATALANNNQFDEAFELFEQSKNVKPDETVTLNSYATALANNNQFEEAFELFEQSKNIKPDETVTLNSYGMALVKNKQPKLALELFEQTLTIEPNNPIALFLYTTVLGAVSKDKYITAIENIKRIEVSPKSKKHYIDFLTMVLGLLHYLIGQKRQGNKYFEMFIQHAKNADVANLTVAKNILAVEPYNQKGIDLLKEITENSPTHSQALKELSLNLSPQEYFEQFKDNDSELKDMEMFNRAIYHKILNEIIMLKVISGQIIADDRASDILADITKRINITIEKIKQRRNKQTTIVQKIPANNYSEIIKVVAETAHDIADIVNNQLPVIKRRIQRVLQNITTQDRFFHKLNKILERVEITEKALSDLKSVNQGINIQQNSIIIKELFASWQNAPKIDNIEFIFDIKNAESSFVGDREKIKSFISELVENSLKHNAENPDLKITISSRDKINQYNKNLPGQKQHLIIEFSDNGQGIPNDKKHWAFLPLETTSKNGTGLGLFIIKRTLKEMNGHIIEDGEEGVGVHFEIDIPYGE
ncbi:ATP-binding protein, partial [Thiotrichales bacterium HSG1]|nr:ATP-binding protein [Thiotrichales bacterium HSG1]